jgi:hypothetical protein
MCCYVRHIRGLLHEASLPDSLPGRRGADRRIRAGLSMADADCPDVWRRVKPLSPSAVLALLTGHAAPPAPQPVRSDAT